VIARRAGVHNQFNARPPIAVDTARMIVIDFRLCG